MKIAIPLTAGRLSDHFGHCEQFALIEADPVSKRSWPKPWSSRRPMSRACCPAGCTSKACR